MNVIMYGGVGGGGQNSICANCDRVSGTKNTVLIAFTLDFILGTSERVISSKRFDDRIITNNRTGRRRE